MFRNERHEEILQLVARDGRVATTELAERYGVSEDSIRKDLQQLDAEGKLQRVYGGAVALADLPARQVVTRVDDHADEKRAIAAKAFGLVEDGMTVFLDVSSTNLYLADLLAASDKRLLVVSNMLELLSRVAAGPNIDAQCPGGHVSSELNGLVGGVTTRGLARGHFDLAFLGTIEFDLERNQVSTFDSEDAAVKMTALENASRAYVVGGSHKFALQGSFRYARLTDFEAIITDELRPEWVARATEAGLAVL